MIHKTQLMLDDLDSLFFPLVFIDIQKRTFMLKPRETRVENRGENYTKTTLLALHKSLLPCFQLLLNPSLSGGFSLRIFSRTENQIKVNLSRKLCKTVFMINHRFAMFFHSVDESLTLLSVSSLTLDSHFDVDYPTDMQMPRFAFKPLPLLYSVGFHCKTFFYAWRWTVSSFINSINDKNIDFFFSSSDETFHRISIKQQLN